MQASKPHWLNRKRLVLYSFAALVSLASIYISWLAHASGHLDKQGRPIGADFITFWGASRLALDGTPAAAYQLPALYAAEQAAVPGLKVQFAWFYPPTFYLLVLPLALAPYIVAYALFMAGTLAMYCAVFWRLLRRPEAMWALAGFSGLWLNLTQGQNAFLTAALAAAALHCLERRPALAGVFLGLLAIKPHLALLFPLALAAAQAWRTLAVAAATALALTIASMAALGAATLAAFFDNLNFARALLEQGLLPLVKMPSLFAAMRVMQLPLWLAYGAQAAGATAAAALVWRAWRSAAPAGLRYALLMTASMLASPYIYDYDLAWLAFPMGWLGLHAARTGWHAGEREMLLALWLLPIVQAPLGKAVPILVGPPLLFAFMWMLWRRIRADGAAQPA
jgi:hypothetical protein